MNERIITLLLSGLIGAFVFISPKVIPLVINSSAIHVWTARDLRRIASDDAILAVLASVRLKIAMDKNSSTKEIIDSAAPQDIRDVLPTRFGWKAGVLEDAIALASTNNAAATCSTPSSAGAGGLDECVSRCERRPLLLIRGKKPHGEGCYALCSLAVAPCHGRPFTWTAWFRAAKLEIEGLLRESAYVLLVVSLATGDFGELSLRFLLALHRITPSQAIVWLGYTYVLDSRRVTLLLFWAFVLGSKYAAKYARTSQTRPQSFITESERRRTLVKESEDAPEDEVAANHDGDDEEGKAEDDDGAEEGKAVGDDDDDDELLRHILATWEKSSSSSSSSSEEEEGKAKGDDDDDDELLRHILATWEKSSSSSSSSSL